MDSTPRLDPRHRPLTPAELASIPWLTLLTPEERTYATAQLRIHLALAGDLICHTGQPLTDWFGVVEGLLKISSETAGDHALAFAGLPPGGWFGESAALKRAPCLHKVQALRKSLIAALPVEAFHHLLGQSLGFNRFVMNQLNERLSQFIAAREIDRTSNPDVRVARNLAALFNPVLCPGVGQVLRITQQELAYLASLSRQRVNEALAVLEKHGLIKVEYGGVRVLNLQGLRTEFRG